MTSSLASVFSRYARTGSLVVLLTGACVKAPTLPTYSPLDASVVAPTLGRVWAVRAQWAESQGDRVAAERAWTWVARLDPNNAHALVAVGRFWLRHGEWSDAREVALRALQREPASGEARWVLAQALVGLGDAEANAQLEQSGVLGVGEAWVMLGHRRADDDLASAGVAWTRAMSESLSSHATRERGRLAVKLERWAEAVDDLVVGLEAEPMDREAFDELVVAATNACRLEVPWRWASAHPGRVSDPSWEPSLAVLRVLVDDPRWRGVDPVPVDRATLRAAKQCDVTAHVERAAGLTACSAVPHLLEAVGAAPVDPTVLDAAAIALQECGRVVEAREIVARAVLVAPTSGRLEQLRDLYEALGDPLAAQVIERRLGALEVH